jgi:hypothetical protein
MAFPPDRNQGRIIGVNLPAFLLSKNTYPEHVRAANRPSGFLARFPSLFPGWSFRRKPPENKKPGVERRAKPPHFGGSARSSTIF